MESLLPSKDKMAFCPQVASKSSGAVSVAIKIHGACGFSVLINVSNVLYVLFLLRLITRRNTAIVGLPALRLAPELEGSEDRPGLRARPFLALSSDVEILEGQLQVRGNLLLCRILKSSSIAAAS